MTTRKLRIRRGTVKDFRKLKVWEKAHRLTLEVYHASSKFPLEEFYGLTSQIRRSCVSIVTNIAEGCGRGTDMDFALFLQIAMGSASEVEYLLLLSQDLNYLPSQDYKRFNREATEIKRMLTSLMKALRRGLS
jgi:four helix bundle protein